MLHKEISEVKSFLRDNVDIEHSLKIESNSLRTQRKLQHLFSKKFANCRSQKVFEIILTYAERAERLCPGAGLRTLKRFLTTSSDEKYVSLRNREDILGAFVQANLSNKTTSIFKEVLNYCGSGVRIKLKKSINSKTFIEASNSYHFKVDSLIKQKLHAITDLKVLVIDGYVENVSELHHVFNHFSTEEPGTPFAIFCRGMSDDVLNTISVNNTRGALNCFPFKVKFDLENVNTLVDIAIVSGTDVISSLKGDLISSIRVTDLKTIDSLTLSKDGILLKNLKTWNSVQTHIRNLKLKSEQSSEQNEFLFARIYSLSANIIDIAIPDDINYYALSQEIDEGIRIITSALDKTFLIEETVSEYSKKIQETLLSLGELL